VICSSSLLLPLSTLKSTDALPMLSMLKFKPLIAQQPTAPTPECLKLFGQFHPPLGLFF
jgi:hypothetical protein